MSLQIILFQPLHKVVYPLHLLGDVDALRTVGRALVASDAMAGLAETGHTVHIPEHTRSHSGSL